MRQSKTSGMMKKKMSTEWKDQSAKCEGDAVLIGHINKSHLPQSHVDTLAQVLALVDKKRFSHRATPHKGLSLVHSILLIKCLNFLDVLCVYLICLHKKGSQLRIRIAKTNQSKVIVTNTKERRNWWT